MGIEQFRQLQLPACVLDCARLFCNSKHFPESKRRSTGPTLGTLMAGRAKRALSCFVMTLSYSRALYLELLLRSNHGELPAWPCARIRIPVRTTASESLWQSQERRAGTPTASETWSNTKCFSKFMFGAGRKETDLTAVSAPTPSPYQVTGAVSKRFFTPYLALSTG